MRTYHAARLTRAIDEKRRPRCSTPGCVFRTPVCPVHGHGDQEMADYRDLERMVSGNGTSKGWG